MIARGIVWFLVGIKPGSEVAITLAQPFVPTPELGAAIRLELSTTEVELELLRPLPKDWRQQFAIGAGLHQIDRLGVAGELALNRGVTPISKSRGFLDPLQQISRTAHLIVVHRGLPDVFSARAHGCAGRLVVGFALPTLEPGHLFVFSFKPGNQHLLVLMACLKQQVIKRLDLRTRSALGVCGMYLFPPGTNHRASAEQR